MSAGRIVAEVMEVVAAARRCNRCCATREARDGGCAIGWGSKPRAAGLEQRPWQLMAAAMLLGAHNQTYSGPGARAGERSLSVNQT